MFPLAFQNGDLKCFASGCKCYCRFASGVFVIVSYIPRRQAVKNDSYLST